MLKPSILLTLMLFVILSLPLPALAAEAASGVIEGQLINRTAGSTSSVADIEVTLATFQNSQQTATATAKTDKDGKFTFSSLSTDSKNSYQITFIYQEADYFGNPLSFGAGEASKSIEIPVYDATNSDEAVKITQAHTIVNVVGGSLQITEYYLFANDTDRAYVGKGEITATGKRRTLDFPLPSKATDIQYGGDLMECCVLSGKGNFTDTMALLPEGKEIIYSYKVPYSGTAYNLEQKFNYPVPQFNLLVQGEGVSIASDKLSNPGTVDMQGTKYTNATGQNLKPGDTVTAQISGLAKSTNPKTVIFWVLGAFVLLAVGAGLAYRKSRSKAKLQAAKVETGSDRKQERLLLEIAELDDDFAAGRIGEAAYRNQRAMKKEQVLRLTRRARESGTRR